MRFTEKMISKKFLCVLLSLAVLLQMSGCGLSFFDPQTVMSPPKANADQQEISELLQGSTKDLTFVYPKLGEYRSAVIMHDFTGNGTEDALGFYMLESGSVEVQFLTKVADETTSSIDVEQDGYEPSAKWTTITKFKNASTQVDRVAFGDINGDGVSDILIGWGSTASLVNASMYAYIYTEGVITEIPIDIYGEMILTDFNEDDVMEIFLTQRLVPAQEDGGAETPAKSSIYEYKDGSIAETHTVAADNSITRFSSISFGNIDRKKKAVVLDGTKADSSMTTQLFFFNAEDKFENFPHGVNDETTSNPLYRPPGAAFTSRDINDDGIIEVPIVAQLEGAMTLSSAGSASSTNSTGFMVSWSAYDENQENGFRHIMLTLMNLSDGYWFTIPRYMSGKITSKYDEKLRAVTYVELIEDKSTEETEELEKEDKDALLGEPLFVIRVFTSTTWEKRGEPGGFEKLAVQGDYIYAMFDYSVGKYTYAINDIKKSFSLITD